jgi:hypothetical protein
MLFAISSSPVSGSFLTLVGPLSAAKIPVTIARELVERERVSRVDGEHGSVPAGVDL